MPASITLRYANDNTRASGTTDKIALLFPIIDLLARQVAREEHAMSAANDNGSTDDSAGNL